MESLLTSLRHLTLSSNAFRNGERLQLTACILFSLYQLQVYYLNEIQRGLCQSGDYKLSAHFANCARDPTEMKFIESICPQDIVDQVQAEQAVRHDIDDEFQPDSKTVDQKSIDKSKGKRPSSQIARANSVLTENRLAFDPKLGVFIVRNSEGNHNAVTLFPKQSCTCASTGECYHIISAKMSLGLHSKEVKSIINLSQLRRNTQARKENKSGRKKFAPAGADVVNPAPDSLKYANEVNTTSVFENNVESIVDESDNVELIVNESNCKCNRCTDYTCNVYLKPSYFSGTLILAILARGLVIAKFNMR